jgi:hypothetical protein
MDISSDENENENFHIDYQVQDEENFPKAYDICFSEEIQPWSEDDLKEEEIYFQNENQFTQNEEKKTTVSSSEKDTIQGHIKGVFYLFHPWTKEYNYDSFYSKKLFFKINNISNISENKDSDPHKRKNMPDNMRKRIKSDYLSKIIIILNESLKHHGLNLEFCLFAQCEVSNVAKAENNKVLNMTLKELILHKPFEDSKKYGVKQKHILNWEKNKAILDYLEKKENQELYKRLDFENILNLKMKDLYNEYLASDEFQKSIEELRDEGNYFEYIKNYISVAKNFNKYYDVEA